MHPPFSTHTCTQVIHTCTVLSYTTYRRLTEQLAPVYTLLTYLSLFFYSCSLIFFLMAIFQVFTDKAFYIVTLRSHDACSPVLVADWWLECKCLYVTSKHTTPTKHTVSQAGRLLHRVSDFTPYMSDIEEMMGAECWCSLQEQFWPQY